mmetsp:Transcript_23335/g.63275  ORF Transcript_23335/g.63275 Transcript_23335/m.63275 type:complete len:207 (+) Transcript_23335:1698-2318(+)
MLQMRAQPSARAMSRSIRMTVSALDESRPLVGSSHTSTRGRARSSLAMLALLSSPPETPRCMVDPIDVCAQSSRPRSRITADTRSRLAAWDNSRGRRRRALKSSVSCTVRFSMKMSRWRTYATSRRSTRRSESGTRRDAEANARPARSTSPVEGSRSPVRAPSMVVLPAPLGPKMAKSSPAVAWPEKGWSKVLPPMETDRSRHSKS